MFLEDNISKLVKLKVASRAKYKEYDENYISYLSAVSVDDEHRIEMYRELTEKSYLWLMEKLIKAISENNELLDTPLVKEYAGLMFATYDESGSTDNGDSMWPDKEIDTRYTRIFEHENAGYIGLYVCYFSKYLSKDEEEELEEKKPTELLKRLEDRVYNHTEEWIDDLPLCDLKVLKDLVKKGRTTKEITFQQLLIERLALVDCSLDPNHPELILYDDIKNAVAPYLDAAIEKKERNNEGFLECLLMGLLNIVGHIEEYKAREVIKNLLPQASIKFKPEDVDRFFDHSMIVKYHRDSYIFQPDNNLWSQLTNIEDWDDEIRDNVAPFYPTDIDDVIAHGKYPYFHPYRKAEQAFYNLLVDSYGFEPSDALFTLTYYYSRLQNPNYTAKDLIQEIMQNELNGGLKQANRLLEVLTNYCNEIPKFILKGNSSSEAFGTLRDQKDPYPDNNAISDYPDWPTQTPYIADPKVGRNDPCPCGSGKKYKKCCGQTS